MTLIKLIATFVLIYLAFRVFTMYLFPALLRWYLKRFQRKFYEQNPHLRKEKPSGKTRSGVNISEDPQQESGKITNKIGEYVDFEEIKEDKKKKE